jgi:hypothetical protein
MVRLVPDPVDWLRYHLGGPDAPTTSRQAMV